MAYLSSLEVLHQLKTIFFLVPLSVIQPLSDFPILSAGPKPGEMGEAYERDRVKLPEQTFSNFCKLL